MKRLDIVIHGAEAVIDEELRMVIKKIRRALFLKGGSRIANVLVAFVRLAAKHPRYGPLISDNCVSMVHTRGSNEIICDDYFLGRRPKTHVPHFVTSAQSFKHIWIQPG